IKRSKPKCLLKRANKLRNEGSQPNLYLSVRLIQSPTSLLSPPCVQTHRPQPTYPPRLNPPFSSVYVSFFFSDSVQPRIKTENSLVTHDTQANISGGLMR
ncbi:hypothetical protein QQP08_025002, partial [Theobroma cacao]